MCNNNYYYYYNSSNIIKILIVIYSHVYVRTILYKIMAYYYYLHRFLIENFLYWNLRLIFYLPFHNTLDNIVVWPTPNLVAISLLFCPPLRQSKNNICFILNYKRILFVHFTRLKL